MDTISQIALGAAVGEAVAGEKAGRKAALYGAIGGVIPDLDILLYPFLDEPARLGVHRGFSHSIFFALLAAPLCGWFLRKIHSRARATFRDWTLLAFAALFTHPLLDYFTIYGTQLLNPLSDYPFQLGSIFIIDPLYTLPLIVGLTAAFFARRNPDRRRFFNLAGLALSSLYLAVGVGSKFTAEAAFERSLRAQNIAFDRLYSSPTPFNIVLWAGLAEDRANDRIWVGLYSHLDDPGPIAFQELEKNSGLIAHARESMPLRRLFWFSRGWYRVTRVEERLVFNDLRFGRSDGWLDEDGRYIFAFELIDDPPGSRRFVSFRRDYFGLSADRGGFGRLGRRILGERTESANPHDDNRSQRSPKIERHSGLAPPGKELNSNPGARKLP